MPEITVKQEIPEALDFEIIHEDWSEYEILGFPARVKFRHIILRVFVPLPSQVQGPMPPGAIGTITTTLATIFAEAPMRGTPLKGPSSPIDENKARIVKWRVIREPENLYRLPGPTPRVFTTRSIVTRIRYVPDHYDHSGEPVFMVEGQAVTSFARDASIEDLGV